MATTAVSSTSSATSTVAANKTAAATTAAANKAAAQKIITSLSAGSGVDTASLAQNLVDAERMPQENGINAKITKNDARVSGFAAVSFVLGEVKTAFAALKDQSSFNALTVDNSNANAFSVTTSATAKTGSYDIDVVRLAKAQRNVSDGVAFATSALNGGKPMTLNLTVGGSASPAISLAAGKDTPQDIVDAINAAGYGVTAKLIDTGDGSAKPFQVVLSGVEGSAGAFTLATGYGTGTGVPGLNFTSTNLGTQTASDAQVKIDGITYTRNTNVLKDIVPGVTINLKAPTTSPAQVNFTRENTAVKDKLTALVTSYNDAMTMLNVVSDPKSTMDTYGATLVGDSTVRMIKQQLRGMFAGTSSTPGTGVGSLWQMGISVDQAGTLAVDSTKLDKALTSNFDDVVKTFSGNQNNLSVYSTAPAGVAGDAVKKLTALLGPTGVVARQSQNATTQNTKYQDDLAKLQTRMDGLLKRYQKQFAAMDSLVGSVNSQKSSLKSSFDGMMAAYTNK
ncbi:FliD Flagellar capping protein [Burkholderiaceae bacterium]